MSPITIKAINKPAPSMCISRPCGACRHVHMKYYCQHSFISCHAFNHVSSFKTGWCSHIIICSLPPYIIYRVLISSVGQLCNEPLIPGQKKKKFINFILRCFLLSNKNLNPQNFPAIRYYSILSHSSLSISTSSSFSFPSSSATVFSTNSTKEEEWPTGVQRLQDVSVGLLPALINIIGLLDARK